MDFYKTELFNPKQELLEFLSKRFNKQSNKIQLKPNFLIPGIAHSGTTTLFSYLIQHPEIFLSINKEINYFTHNFTEGDRWYLSHFLANKNYNAVGEASVTYFSERKVIQRIKKFNPDFKIIIMLRNPVERTYSSYKWHVQHTGYSKSFYEVISKTNRFKINYIKPIKYFLENFNRDEIYFQIFEDFIIHPQEALKKICSFLKVSPNFKFDSFKINFNPSQIPLSLKLQQFCTKHLDIFRGDPKDPILKKLLIHSIRWIITSFNNIYSRQFPKINNESRQLLKDHYQNEIIILEDLIEKNLDLWKD